MGEVGKAPKLVPEPKDERVPVPVELLEFTGVDNYRARGPKDLEDEEMDFQVFHRALLETVQGVVDENNLTVVSHIHPAFLPVVSRPKRITPAITRAGFRKVEILGDGNCLFRSFSYFLKGSDPVALRQKTLQNWFSALAQMGFQVSELMMLNNPRVWDTPAYDAFAHCALTQFGRRHGIRLWRLDQEGKLEPFVDFPSARRPLEIGWNLLFDHNHYDVLLPEVDLEKELALRPTILSTTVGRVRSWRKEPRRLCDPELGSVEEPLLRGSRGSGELECSPAPVVHLDLEPLPSSMVFLDEEATVVGRVPEGVPEEDPVEADRRMEEEFIGSFLADEEAPVVRIGEGTPSVKGGMMPGRAQLLPQIVAAIQPPGGVGFNLFLGGSLAGARVGDFVLAPIFKPSWKPRRYSAKWDRETIVVDFNRQFAPLKFPTCNRWIMDTWVRVGCLKVCRIVGQRDRDAPCELPDWVEDRSYDESCICQRSLGLRMHESVYHDILGDITALDGTNLYRMQSLIKVIQRFYATDKIAWVASSFIKLNNMNATKLTEDNIRDPNVASALHGYLTQKFQWNAWLIGEGWLRMRSSRAYVWINIALTALFLTTLFSWALSYVLDLAPVTVWIWVLLLAFLTFYVGSGVRYMIGVVAFYFKVQDIYVKAASNHNVQASYGDEVWFWIVVPGIFVVIALWCGGHGYRRRPQPKRKFAIPARWSGVCMRSYPLPPLGGGIRVDGTPYVNRLLTHSSLDFNKPCAPAFGVSPVVSIVGPNDLPIVCPVPISKCIHNQLVALVGRTLAYPDPNNVINYQWQHEFVEVGSQIVPQLAKSCYYDNDDWADTQEFLDHFDSKRKEILMRARDRGRKETASAKKTEYHVKKENYLKFDRLGRAVGFMPRTIQQHSDGVLINLGGWVRALTRAFMQLWNVNVRLHGLSVDVYYATGKTAEEIGGFIRDCEMIGGTRIMINGDDMVAYHNKSYYAFDYSKYDATNGWAMNETRLRLLESFPPANHYACNLVKAMMGETEIHSKGEGLIVGTITYQVKTGESLTKSLNDTNNLITFCWLLSRHPNVFEGSFKEQASNISQALKQIGFKLSLCKISRSWQDVDFCSARILRNGAGEYLLARLPGRVIGKTLQIRHDVREGHMKELVYSIASGIKAESSFDPFLRTLSDRLIDLTVGHHVLHRDPDAEYHFRTAKEYDIDWSILRYYEEVYGLSSDDTKEMIVELGMLQFYQPLQHPGFFKMFQTDVPPEDEEIQPCDPMAVPHPLDGRSVPTVGQLGVIQNGIHSQ
jgi:hypothetical protein